MILAVIVFGFLLRVISLNQSFWLDEATSGLVVRNFNLVEIITKFSPGDFHPPLYYLLLKVWSYIFGTNEIALRFPSIIFGLLTVYLVYRIALLITVHRSQFTAIIAALLLATSGLHIYYSQEARMYALTAFLVTFALFFFIKIVKNDRLGDWILFSISLFLIASTDYVAILIFPVFLVLGIIIKKNLKWFIKLLTSHIILLLFAIVWSPIFLKQLGVGISVSSFSPSWSNLLGTFSFKNFALIPVKFILGRISFDDKYTYALLVSLTASLFGYLMIKSTRQVDLVKNLRIIWLWLVVPILLGIIISLRLSIFSYFRFLFVLPAFYLLVAVSLEKLKPKLSSILIVVLVGMNLIFSGIYLFNPRFHREDWRGLVSFVESHKTKDSVTLFVADSNMEAYKYYDSSANISGSKGFSTKYEEIWLMRYLQPVFDSNDSLCAKIEASVYNKEKEYDFNGVVVWKYIKR